tara:strand:- start:684 stop:1244 length:561 start_codon:yes stop_codon:yes gene_type:complete
MANEACDKLKSGILVDVFGSDASIATFREGSKYVPHKLCTASWDKPNHQELTKAVTQYETQKAMAKMLKQEFNKIAPPAAGYSVSLTIIDQIFDSPQDAVASLENTVTELSKGVNVTVKGKVHTTQVEFNDWIEDIGNKAIWAPKLGELQVADNNGRFAVTVKGFSDASQNLSKAVNLAKQIVNDH